MCDVRCSIFFVCVVILEYRGIHKDKNTLATALCIDCRLTGESKLILVFIFVITDIVETMDNFVGKP